MTSGLIAWVLQHKLAVIVIGVLVLVFQRQLVRTTTDLLRSLRASLAEHPIVCIAIVVLALTSVAGFVPNRDSMLLIAIALVVLLLIGWFTRLRPEEPPPEEETGVPPGGGVA